jgi:hypothetical protein
MASVSKSKTGDYYLTDRIWQEHWECGIDYFYVGKWRGTYRIPDEPRKRFFRELLAGHPLARVQENRIAVYDVTFSWDKTVSIATYGMTPPEKWGEWSKEYAEVVRKILEPRVNSQVAKTGAQGAVQVPSRGLALVFMNWKGAFGQIHAHQHAAIPNLTATSEGKAYSIGNAHREFRDQALMRATANKLMDDRLRAKGFKTERRGKVVAVSGIPDDMVRALSPGRDAMERARKAMDRARKAKGMKKRPRGPRARDFEALKANSEGKKVAGGVTPEKAYAYTQAIANRYDFTPEKLRSTPAASNPSAEQYVAYELALDARDRCTRRFGSFTEQQYQTEIYTLGIGKPVSFETLASTAKLVLRSRTFAGIERTVTDDGHVRYHVMPTPEMSFGGPNRAASKENGAAHGAPKESAKGPTARTGATEGATRENGSQPDPRETFKQAEGPFVREAWAELKRAAKGLGEAVLVATTKKATDVLTRVAEYVNPAPKTLRIDAADLDLFLARHHRTHFLVAHAKALVKGLLAGGNPHEMAAVAETAFARLRDYNRVRKNTVIVVENGQLADAVQLRKLARIAKRDGASVVLSERPEPEKAFGRPKRAGKGQRLRNTLRQNGFRPNRDRIH